MFSGYIKKQLGYLDVISGFGFTVSFSSQLSNTASLDMWGKPVKRNANSGSATANAIRYFIFQL